MNQWLETMATFVAGLKTAPQPPAPWALWLPASRWAFLASVATVVGLLLGIITVVIAWNTYREQVRQAKQHRDTRRATIFHALHVEIVGIRTGIELDLQDFDKADLSHQAYFVWRPYPTTVIEQAVQEATLLELNADRVTQLETLLLWLMHINVFVDAKVGTLPGLESNIVAEGAGFVNLQMLSRLKQVRDECSKILEWLTPLTQSGVRETKGQA